MSRIGKKPILIPKGVTVQFKAPNLEIKGPAGTLNRVIPKEITMQVAGDQLTVSKDEKNQSSNSQALFGLMRTLIANMIAGVVHPWKREMEIQGVGYRATKTGQNLNLQLGLSHPIDFTMPPSVQFTVDPKQTLISLTCPDKELLGSICARIRSVRPPEPYKGKGVRYLGEHILRKAGKAAGAVGGKK